MKTDDPEDSPIVRHVLYTNEVSGLLAAFVSALLLRARPERVKAALEGVLADFDERVAQTRLMVEAIAAGKCEPSGWKEPDDKETVQ